MNLFYPPIIPLLLCPSDAADASNATQEKREEGVVSYNLKYISVPKVHLVPKSIAFCP